MCPTEVISCPLRAVALFCGQAYKHSTIVVDYDWRLADITTLAS